MSKHHPPESLAQALESLQLDPSMEPAVAVAALRGKHEQPDANRAAIAHALGLIQLNAAVHLLAEMEAASSGVTRREIRRALFKLRQHVIAPAPAAESAERATPAAIAGSSMSALLSPIDADGARIVWIVKARPAGGSSRLWGLTSESEGLVGATLSNLSSKQLRAERKEIEQRAQTALVEGDWRLADFILCEAYRRTPESRRVQVGNFLMLRAEIISDPPPVELAHPIYHEFAAELANEPSVELLKEPEVAGWKLPADKTKPYVDEVNDVRQSPLVLNRFQQEERINGIVERAISELLSGETALLARRRLEDTAYYLARAGRRPAAAWAAAAAARLRDNAELKRVPFFQELVRANLGAILAEQEEHQREEPRLIATPAEAMRERQQRSGQR
ncbi:MAG TPA: hypothetical protein VMB26_05110 [Candidatus Binataceae bacterium]|nr:hypothetical protein [Candidatus Binataceae bacterium]